MNFINSINIRRITLLSFQYLKTARQRGICQTHPPQISFTNLSRNFCTVTRNTDTTKTSSNYIPKPPDAEQQPHPEEVEYVGKLFPTPKLTLNNILAVVSAQLKNKELYVSPVFKKVKHGKTSFSWMCTYNIKWPESKTFCQVGITKQEASRKTSLLVLSWLKQLHRITPDGKPIVVDKEEAKQLKEAPFVFKIGEKTQEKLQRVVGKYEEFLEQPFEDCLSGRDADRASSVETAEIERMESMRIPFQQRYEGPNAYLNKTQIELPITEFKERILELSRNNSVVVIKGEPGCGKSTQVPQFLLEDWAVNGGPDGEPCRIVVSQPRRIAAISLASRVAGEKMDEVGGLVGFQVRFNSAISNRTRITYCTTGILLRYIQSDPELKNFTHILIDEAHERDVNTDLLLNLLRNAVDKNPNLKVIIMSATIDTAIFQKYFNDAPSLNIPGFTFPVQINFLDEILHEVRAHNTLEMCRNYEPYIVHDDVVEVLLQIHQTRREGAILCFLPGWEDITRVKRLMPQLDDAYILCLHSRLQDFEQRKIFSRPPPGIRKIILATNIAETSVTVDDVVYVVDTGVHKEERFDSEKGLASIDNHWISKASMEQRKGRAGRVQPGESFHLYTRAKYDTFAKYSIPEILRTSLTKVVLDSKIYSQNTSALDFFNQLLCPPEEETIERAVDELKELELLESDESLTPLGRVLANFQLEPRLSRAMVNAVAFKCVAPIVDVISLFSGGSELFSKGLMDKEGIRRTKEKFCKNSDHLALMRLFENYLEIENSGDRWEIDEFCRKNNLVKRRLQTISRLRDVHFDYLYKGLRRSVPIADNNSDNDELVKAALLSGVHSILQPRNFEIVKGRMKKANVHITSNNHKATVTTESVNYQRCRTKKDLFLLYLNEVRSNLRRTTIVRETSVISPLSVLLFKPNELKLTHTDEEEETLLTLQGTKLKFSCTKRQAEVIEKCKRVLQKGLRYYVYQMTEGENFDTEVDKRWQEVLEELCDALKEEAVRDEKKEDVVV